VSGRLFRDFLCSTNLAEDQELDRLLEPETALRRHTIHSKHNSGSRSFNFSQLIQFKGEINYAPLVGDIKRLEFCTA
jgi:hypothetical protein